MPIFQTQELLRKHLDTLDEHTSLGLVPTMGALHQGHLALVQRALDENEHVVVSIFVNPTQFDKEEDLIKYPKTLAKDEALLNSVSENIIIYAPEASDVYDNEVKAKKYDFDNLDKVMEGAFRDDHFNGVGTIVEALFSIIKPQKAYFGEKDYQQLQIIKNLVHQQHLSVAIVPCPIIREPNGLALSSRNERLSPEMRQKASFIYETLLTAKEKFGTKSAYTVKNWVTKTFAKHSDFELEYIEIANAETLAPTIKKSQFEKYRAFIAVYAEGVRLIDNIALN